MADRTNGLIPVAKFCEVSYGRWWRNLSHRVSSYSRGAGIDRAVLQPHTRSPRSMVLYFLRWLLVPPRRDPWLRHFVTCVDNGTLFHRRHLAARGYLLTRGYLSSISSDPIYSSLIFPTTNNMHPCSRWSNRVPARSLDGGKHAYTTIYMSGVCADEKQRSSRSCLGSRVMVAPSASFSNSPTRFVRSSNQQNSPFFLVFIPRPRPIFREIFLETINNQNTRPSNHHSPTGYLLLTTSSSYRLVLTSEPNSTTTATHPRERERQRPRERDRDIDSVIHCDQREMCNTAVLAKMRQFNNNNKPSSFRRQQSAAVPHHQEHRRTKREREAQRTAGRPAKRVSFSSSDCVLGRAQDYDRTSFEVQVPLVRRRIIPRRPAPVVIIPSDEESKQQQQQQQEHQHEQHANFCGMWRRSHGFNWASLLEFSGVDKADVAEQVRPCRPSPSPHSDSGV